MWCRILFSILGAASIALASAPASSATKFGAKLNRQLTPAEQCKASKKDDMCSWVLTQAQNNAGREQAPKNGTIGKLRLMACGPGSFILQIVKVKPADRARAIRTGPLINYKGNPHNCTGSGNFKIETFTVNVPVQKGDYLSVVATKVSFIYNASGDGSLVFDPPLPDGGPFRKTTGSGLGSGFLMLQAEYND